MKQYFHRKTAVSPFLFLQIFKNIFVFKIITWHFCWGKFLNYLLSTLGLALFIKKCSWAVQIPWLLTNYFSNSLPFWICVEYKQRVKRVYQSESCEYPPMPKLSIVTWVLWTYLLNEFFKILFWVFWCHSQAHMFYYKNIKFSV